MSYSENFKKLKLETRNYKDLGFQNGWPSIYLNKDKKPEFDKNLQVYFSHDIPENPEYHKCCSLGHKTIEIQGNSRGSDNLVVCHECKIRWHYDCSD